MILLLWRRRPTESNLQLCFQKKQKSFIKIYIKKYDWWTFDVKNKKFKDRTYRKTRKIISLTVTYYIMFNKWMLNLTSKIYTSCTYSNTIYVRIPSLNVGSFVVNGYCLYFDLKIEKLSKTTMLHRRPHFYFPSGDVEVKYAFNSLKKSYYRFSKHSFLL